MNRAEPTPYTELAEVLAALPLLVREARRARGLSQRAAAQQMGVSYSTISRLESGEDLVMSNVSTALCWLDARPDSPTPDETT